MAVSRRANEGEKQEGGQSPLAITLVAGEKSERFITQPPVRPAVLFGSDPTHELEVGSRS